MTDIQVQPLHLGIVFMTIELILLALVGIGLHAMALGREVIWECRWRWPYRLAAAYARLRAAEITNLATWQRVTQQGRVVLRSEVQHSWAILRSFTSATTRDFLRRKISTARGSRKAC